MSTFGDPPLLPLSTFIKIYNTFSSSSIQSFLIFLHCYSPPPIHQKWIICHLKMFNEHLFDKYSKDVLSWPPNGAHLWLGLRLRTFLIIFFFYSLVSELSLEYFVYLGYMDIQLIEITLKAEEFSERKAIFELFINILKKSQYLLAPHPPSFNLIT